MQSNLVRHSAHHLDLSCIDRGHCGELVASLLITQGCDTAHTASSSRRWVTVDVYTDELLPLAEYEILKESFPTFYHPEERGRFATKFKDHGI
jgi:hypothetical protein